MSLLKCPPLTTERPRLPEVRVSWSRRGTRLSAGFRRPSRAVWRVPAPLPRDRRPSVSQERATREL